MEKELRDFLAKKTHPDFEWKVIEDNGKDIILEAVDIDNLDFENGIVRVVVRRRNGDNGGYRITSSNL